MGYYTSYNLSVSGGEELPIIAELRARYRNAEYVLDENGDTYDSCKWYDHEEELIDFSKDHPDLLFTLNGEGEDSGDMWFKYFKNGKIQRCQANITFDEYDESKLK